MKQVVIRVTSHRAFDKVEKLLGRRPFGHWTVDTGRRGNGYYYVPAKRAEEVAAIKSVTVLQRPPKLHPCWSNLSVHPKNCPCREAAA